MGTEIFNLEGKRKNPLVSGIGFVLTVIYAFVITSYLQTVGEWMILRSHSRIDQVIILTVAIATVGYLIIFAVENHLWTEQYEREINPQEYRLEIIQHFFHILGTILLLGFAESQALILSNDPIDVHLLLSISLLALALRYLLFAGWQATSFIRDIEDRSGLRMIGVWVQNSDFLEKDTRWIEPYYAGLVAFIISPVIDINNRNNTENQTSTVVSGQKINSIRNSVCSVPFYIIMFLLHFTIPALIWFDIFPDNIIYLLLIPAFVLIYIIPYYIIWRPFYFRLHNINEN
jgi:hypothetical protein